MIALIIQFYKSIPKKTKIILLVLIAGFVYSKQIGFTFIGLLLLYFFLKSIPYTLSLTGKLIYRMGKSDLALLLIALGYRLARKNTSNAILYGYILLKEGQLEKAKAIFESLSRNKLKAQDEQIVKSNLSLILWKEGKLEQAIEILEDIFTSYKNTAVYGSLGYMLTQSGNLEKALNINLEAIEYNPNDGVILDNLGYTYFLLEQYQKSYEIYQRLLKESPTFPEAYYNYALLLEVMGEKDEAIKYMKKSLECPFSFLSSINRSEVEASVIRLNQTV